MLSKCRDCIHFPEAPRPCVPPLLPQPLSFGKNQDCNLVVSLPLPLTSFSLIPSFSSKASQRRVTTRLPSSLNIPICHQNPEPLWEKTASGRGHSYFKLTGVGRFRDESGRLVFHPPGKSILVKQAEAMLDAPPGGKKAVNEEGGSFKMPPIPKAFIFKSPLPCLLKFHLYLTLNTISIQRHNSLSKVNP